MNIEWCLKEWRGSATKKFPKVELIGNLKYLIALNAHPKIGSQTLKKVLAVLDNDLERIWCSSERDLTNILETRIVSNLIEAREKYKPDVEVEKLKAMGIGYITLYDKLYPKLLLETNDCPVILYIKGNPECLNGTSIAVVGSRKYSNYGKRIATTLTGECVKAGLAIVSGLALGIDSIVHYAALENYGLTIGVLGCGLDKIYPSSNDILGKRMISSGGALISEFPPGTQPFKQNFPLRNRIIAGLCLGTLVIEAREKSGALITAYEALDYNREVFSVPGNIDNEGSFGTNKLIQGGAKLVMSAEDIFEELNLKKQKTFERIKKIVPDNDEERVILSILEKSEGGELSGDMLIKESGLNVIVLNETLTMMEIKGKIENSGGSRYRKCQ